MVDYIIKLLEKWRTLAGWITAIVQLLIWLIGGLFFYFRERKRKKEIKTIFQEKEYWKEECYKMKDKANEWHQLTKEAVNIMKYNTPGIYEKFVESYGGEDKFQEWWQLPNIPIIEDKKEEDK